ncbi:hypothetical protein [Salinisphaera sp. T31B1]|uniref:hypothetical protein n=1 Tax=Salinisphaera sp. T31B1 TaxID=727963 RepID=UPI00334136FD
MIMRFVCEIDGDEHLVDAETPEQAAQEAARRHAERPGQTTAPVGRYTVNVAEANEADLPLIAGDDYIVDTRP